MKKLKILISAYACEPDKGSEPFLGWRWSNEIAKHHEVWVITKENNRPSIEAQLSQHPNPNFHFIYVDLKGIIKKYKKGRRGMQLYVYLWQKKAYDVASKIHQKEKFDLVHHLTFGAYTQPTFMWKLNIPFLWGPLGGGEKLPFIEGRKIDLRSRMYEILRNIQMNTYKFFPFTQGALKNANRILVTTQDTYNLIPHKYRHKCELFQSLGIDDDFMSGDVPIKNECDKRIKILVVGRMIGWKGFDIAIDAFIKAMEKNDNIDLYLRGRGVLKDKILKRCGTFLNKRIFYVDKWFDYKDMYGFYSKHDIFLNCTLHDSGCLTILEAMSAGLPIITIDCGGPHVITQENNAIKIAPQKYSALIDEIANGINTLAKNEKLRKEMGYNSKQIINNEFLYNIKYKKLEEFYNIILNQ